MWLSSDERIRTLEWDLDSARRAIVSLLPQFIQTLVDSRYACQSWEDAYKWESELVDEIITSATVLSREEGSHFGPRACCPLCGHGSSALYARGFAVPEGLRRHLIGWGNTTGCGVLTPVLDLARDTWRPRFEKAEAEMQAQREAHLAERRQRESLVLIGPSEAPLLNDEKLGFQKEPREAQSLNWAETRLAQLGFQLSESERVRSFTKHMEDHVVYADPRLRGELTFFVYPAPSAASARRRSRSAARRETFALPDKWRHDLDEKFASRLARAIEALRQKKRRYH